MTDTQTDPGASTAVVAYHEGMHSIEMAPAAWQLAHRLADTEFVPKPLRGKPGAVLACILTGHELGIDPMQSLQKIHVIDGRPSMAAELMRALVIRHGHDIWFESMSTASVTIIGKRRDKDRTTTVTWTMDDARKANLADKDNWRKYPMDMLAARATGRLCRAIFPDVLAGLSYTLEELSDGEIVNDEDLGVAAAAIIAGTSTPAPSGEPVRSRHRASKRTTPAAPAGGATSSPAGTKPPLPGEDDIADAEIVDPVDMIEVDPDDADITDAEIVDDGLPAQPEFDVDPPTDADARPPESPQGDQPGSGATDASVIPDADASPRLSGPQMVAMKFGQKGITDRAIRLKMSSELVGREIKSGNDLSVAEVHIILDALDDMGDDTVPSEPAAAAVVTEGVRSGPPDPPAQRPQTPSPDGWTGDQWRHFIQTRGIKASVTLKKARELSGASIPTLDDIAGHGIAEELLEFIEDAATS